MSTLKFPLNPLFDVVLQEHRRVIYCRRCGAEVVIPNDVPRVLLLHRDDCHVLRLIRGSELVRPIVHEELRVGTTLFHEAEGRLA